MLARILSRATLIAAVPILVLGCAGDLSTAPEGASLARGGVRPGKVSLANLALESTTLIIDGLATNYIVDIVNDGGKLSDITLQGILTQPGDPNIHGAGGTEVRCGGAAVLPHGTCRVGFTAQASNTSGPATLVAGPATFTLSVLNVQGQELTSVQVAVTLQ